ncbi:MAG: hypothetical protein E7462_07410 [Ruminococcaceae bacterium]|nr:hypothetical protein [Oscillospiraceae bacterium]
MKNTKTIWLCWGILYLLCAACGFIPNPSGLGYGMLILLGIGFFVPPCMLIYEAVRTKQRKLLKKLRRISILSLVLTLGLILGNLLAVHASEAWGTVLYWMLILVSVPMVCCQFWVIGLFGWAVLLMSTFVFAAETK